MLTIAALALTLGAGFAELSGSLQNRFSAFTDVRHVVAIGLILLVIAVAARLIAESLFAALRRAQENSAALRELSARHDSLREEERARVAREIHDELGQALAALRLDLSALEMKFGERAPEESMNLGSRDSMRSVNSDSGKRLHELLARRINAPNA